MEVSIGERIEGKIENIVDPSHAHGEDQCTVFLQLSGLPLDHLDQFTVWKDNIIRPEVPFGDMDAAAEIRRSTGQAMYAYFGDVIDDRVANPGDDVISRFVHGLVEDRAMSRDEILDICYLFILGGLDTVTSTLDCSIAYLAQRPEHRQALVDQPELVPHAVEELLRLAHARDAGAPRRRAGARDARREDDAG